MAALRRVRQFATHNLSGRMQYSTSLQMVINVICLHMTFMRRAARC